MARLVACLQRRAASFTKILWPGISKLSVCWQSWCWLSMLAQPVKMLPTQDVTHNCPRFAPASPKAHRHNGAQIQPNALKTSQLSGSHAGLGPGGRVFESSCPDHLKIGTFLDFRSAVFGVGPSFGPRMGISCSPPLPDNPANDVHTHASLSLLTFRQTRQPPRSARPPVATRSCMCV